MEPLDFSALTNVVDDYFYPTSGVFDTNGVIFDYNQPQVEPQFHQAPYESADTLSEAVQSIFQPNEYHDNIEALIPLEVMEAAPCQPDDHTQLELQHSDYNIQDLANIESNPPQENTGNGESMEAADTVCRAKDQALMAPKKAKRARDFDCEVAEGTAKRLKFDESFSELEDERSTGSVKISFEDDDKMTVMTDLLYELYGKLSKLGDWSKLEFQFERNRFAGFRIIELGDKNDPGRTKYACMVNRCPTVKNGSHHIGRNNILNHLKMKHNN